ncbi:hypothetical protein Q765_20860, partial [Flavobacterium rivuli WB 3.3-2 = DSM 21788]
RLHGRYASPKQGTAGCYTVTGGHHLPSVEAALEGTEYSVELENIRNLLLGFKEQKLKFSYRL